MILRCSTTYGDTFGFVKIAFYNHEAMRINEQDNRLKLENVVIIFIATFIGIDGWGTVKVHCSVGIINETKS